MNGSFTNAAGTVYVNLDSYWSNLSGSQLADFTALCHANGEKAGTYWTPFVWWGTAAQGSNTLIDGDTNYFYSDAYLRTTNGQPQTVDGGIALDPTHPGTQAQIANYIWYFNSLGFDYIKLDFLSHGASRECITARMWSPAFKLSMKEWHISPIKTRIMEIGTMAIRCS
jgi:alpha-galactosidase